MEISLKLTSEKTNEFFTFFLCFFSLLALFLVILTKSFIFTVLLCFFDTFLSIYLFTEGILELIYVFRFSLSCLELLWVGFLPVLVVLFLGYSVFLMRVFNFYLEIYFYERFVGLLWYLCLISGGLWSLVSLTIIGLRLLRVGLLFLRIPTEADLRILEVLHYLDYLTVYVSSILWHSCWNLWLVIVFI